MRFAAKKLRCGIVLTAFAALLALFNSAPASAASCRHALVLALDISGSVNQLEYEQQIEGLASAMLAPDVQELILSRPEAPISVAVFEWSSDKHQRLIVNWTELTSSQKIQGVAAQLRSHNKDRVTLKTAIGSALRFGKALLDQKQTCLRHTIDISGDGINNDGETPHDTYIALGFGNITVNGLVIDIDPLALDNPISQHKNTLKRYFDAKVIRGPDAFSMTAFGYRDYKRAMIHKLIRELSPNTVSDNRDTHEIKTVRPL